MALELVNFAGWETKGIEECASTGGTVVADTVVFRSGAASVKLESGAYMTVRFDEGTLANKFICGFGFRFDTNPGVNYTIFRMRASGPNDLMLLRLRSADRKIELLDITLTVKDTSDLALSADTWYYFEVLFEGADAGSVIVHIDGGEELTASFDTYVDELPPVALFEDAGCDTWYDDVYMYTGATDTGDFLGVNAEVIGPYQNTVEDATDQGTPLDQGTWAITGDTPCVEDAVPAGYTGGASDGHTICDEGARPGPAGDTIGTLKGVKWIHRLMRGGGSGTIHTMRYGHSGDTTTKGISPGTSYGNFYAILEPAASQCPTESEYSAQGFTKDGGGREIYCADMWATLLHVVTAVPRIPRHPAHYNTLYVV